MSELWAACFLHCQDRREEVFTFVSALWPASDLIKDTVNPLRKSPRNGDHEKCCEVDRNQDKLQTDTVLWCLSPKEQHCNCDGVAEDVISSDKALSVVLHLCELLSGRTSIGMQFVVIAEKAVCFPEASELSSIAFSCSSVSMLARLAWRHSCRLPSTSQKYHDHNECLSTFSVQDYLGFFSAGSPCQSAIFLEFGLVTAASTHSPNSLTYR